MKSTTNYALPYPESSEHTRTWEFWQALAEGVDQVLAAGKFNRPYLWAAHPSVNKWTNTNNFTVNCDVVTVNKGPFVSGPAGVTIPIKGIYEVSWRSLCAGSVSQFQARVMRGAEQLAWAFLWVPVTSSNTTIRAVRSNIELNAGDVLTPQVTYAGDVFGTGVGGEVLSEMTLTLRAAT